MTSLLFEHIESARQNKLPHDVNGEKSLDKSRLRKYFSHGLNDPSH